MCIQKRVHRQINVVYSELNKKKMHIRNEAPNRQRQRQAERESEKMNENNYRLVEVDTLLYVCDLNDFCIHSNLVTDPPTTIRTQIIK